MKIIYSLMYHWLCYWLTACVVWLPCIAWGSFSIEPYGGGGVSYSHISTDNNNQSDISTSLSFGLRTGYKVLPLFTTGLDFFYNRHNTGSNSFRASSVVVNNPSRSAGFLQARDTVSIQYSKLSDNFNPLSIGWFGAIDLPFILDTYGTVFYSFGEISAVSYSGPGIKLGLSWLSFFFAQFNVELQWTHYICGGTSCLQQNNFNMMSLMVLVSIPFSTKILSGGGVQRSSSSASSSWEGDSSDDENTITEENMTNSTNPVTEQL